MAVTVKEGEPLCAEQKERVTRVVYDKMAPDDRYPYKVVAEDFGGDWDCYLRCMAGWHGIDLSKIGKALGNADF